METAAVRVLASLEAVEFVRGRGGTLFVWADVANCCTGGLTFLEASTESPGASHRFARMPGRDFDLYLDVGEREPPDEIHLEVKGWARKRIRAYWNGCAYAL